MSAPRHAPGSGPLVKVDEGHRNFHTIEGGYRVFGRVLEADGYRVAAYRGRFLADSLRTTEVMVIANALNERNLDDWNTPNPSAFDSSEIVALKQWVIGGGALFLIADHMPFAGAAQDLGQAFGVNFLNCYALDERHRLVERFSSDEGLDRSHPIVNGQGLVGPVDTVVTFTGSAFRIGVSAEPFLLLSEHYVLWEPLIDGVFNADTPKRNARGWQQGACLNYGKGRVVIFGEAAMFSGQLVGPQYRPMGLNQPEAKDNITLLRNIIAWLTEARP